MRRGGASRAVAGGSSAISCGDFSAPPAAFSADVPGAKAPQDFRRTRDSVYFFSTFLSESPAFTIVNACGGGGPDQPGNARVSRPPACAGCRWFRRVLLLTAGLGCLVALYRARRHA